MPNFDHFLLSNMVLIDWLMNFLLRVLLMSTVLLGAAILACRIMKRASAADRHMVLFTSLVAVLFAPLLTSALPFLPFFSTVNPVDSISLLVPSRVEAPPAIAIPWFLREPVLYMLALTVVWPVGLLFFGSRLVAGAFVASRLQRSPSVPDGIARLEVERIGGELGIRRRVLVVTAPLATPLTTGITSPVVALPSDVAQWSSGRLRCAIYHELAHVGRMDVLSQGIAHAVRAILWFQPLAWLVARRLCAEAEAACDDVVVNNKGIRPSVYAEELLHIAQSAAHVPSSRYSFSVGMSYGPRVDVRVRALLGEGNTHEPCSRLLRLCAAVLAIVLLIPFGSGGHSLTGEELASEPSQWVEDKRLVEPQYEVPESSVRRSESPSPGRVREATSARQ